MDASKLPAGSHHNSTRLAYCLACLACRLARRPHVLRLLLEIFLELFPAFLLLIPLPLLGLPLLGLPLLDLPDVEICLDLVHLLVLLGGLLPLGLLLLLGLLRGPLVLSAPLSLSSTVLVFVASHIHRRAGGRLCWETGC